MNDPTNPAPPRVVIELTPNGTYIAEYYRNGQRERVPLNRDEVGWGVQDALSSIARDRKAQAERKQAKADGEALSRHRRVWNNVAYGTDGARGHGADFANKTVGARNKIAPLTDAERLALREKAIARVAKLEAKIAHRATHATGVVAPKSHAKTTAAKPRRAIAPAATLRADLADLL